MFWGVGGYTEGTEGGGLCNESTNEFILSRGRLLSSLSNDL